MRSGGDPWASRMSTEPWLGYNVSTPPQGSSKVTRRASLEVRTGGKNFIGILLKELGEIEVVFHAHPIFVLKFKVLEEPGELRAMKASNPYTHLIYLS